ncbi:MAG: TetR/AcrR family transcriptional regulator [Pseudobdellovibrionaceae bacterium]
MKTKEKILLMSIELFNKHGVGVVTTNHIAKALNMSPGNLYFHFDNKEEIVYELFLKMCKNTYQIWRPRKVSASNLIEFIDMNFQIYWDYRFFHREMYALRRKDVRLAKLWRYHIKRVMQLMEILYRKWMAQGLVTPISSREEMQYVSDSLLALATTFLQFFESTEKQATEKSIMRGKLHLTRVLLPYAQGPAKIALLQFLEDAKSSSFDL